MRPKCRVCQKPVSRMSARRNKPGKWNTTCGGRICLRETKVHATRYEWRPDPRIVRKHLKQMAKRDYLLSLRDNWYAGRA